MNKLNAVSKQFVIWTKNGKNFWLVILPLGVLIASFVLLKGAPKGLNSFKLIGIFTEMAGLATVVWSLSRENEKYNQNGYLRSFVVWISDAKYILFPRTITAHFDTCLGCISSIGTGVVTGSLDFENIEQKVEFLLQKIIVIEKSINESFSKIESLRTELKTELATLKSNIEVEIAGVKNEMKEKATIDYCLLVSGSILTAIGMIITNLPDYYFSLLDLHS